MIKPPHINIISKHLITALQLFSCLISDYSLIMTIISTQPITILLLLQYLTLRLLPTITIISTLLFTNYLLETLVFHGTNTKF